MKKIDNLCVCVFVALLKKTNRLVRNEWFGYQLVVTLR